MTEECRIRCMTDRDIQTEGRLARIEAGVAALSEKFDEAVVTQIRDHGKRIARLEGRWIWLMGWMAGAGTVGGLVSTLLQRYL